MALSDGDLERLRATVAGSTFVERYAVTREAGAGGMGKVYDATDRGSGQRVAIKVLSGHRGGGARFEAEVEILERLSHPAIVAYVGHGVTDAGEPYLAMTWLDGETLGARLAQGATSVADAVAIGTRIVDALVYAHAQGVVHRDIKPSNVFLVDGRPDRAMLIDFGVAKDTAVSRDLTHTGEVIGTPGYMAPEQVMGKTDLDGRADLFAVGCLLHECLAGRPLFDGNEVMVVLARLLLHDPPRLATLRDDVPARLDALIAALLAKQPEHRLADAGLVATELAVIATALAAGDAATLAATPIAVPAPTDLGEAVTMLERPRPARAAPPARAWWIAGLAVVAVAAIAIALVVAARSGERAVGPGSGAAGAGPAGSGRAGAAAVAPGGVCTDREFSGCAALCDGGQLEACHTLGVALVYGRRGTAMDVPRGRALLDRACRAGDGSSCVSLGLHVRTSISQHPETGTAADWIAIFERGCDIPFAFACLQLAQAYDGQRQAGAAPSNGSVAVDPVRATSYYERACTSGAREACVPFADRLRAGTGIAADPARAEAVRRDACARGFKLACDPDPPAPPP